MVTIQQNYSRSDVKAPNVGEWLLELLNKTPRPDVPTKKDLCDLVDAALKAKIAEIENKNLVLPANMKRKPPETLKKREVAAILNHMFFFKDVLLSGTDDQYGELMIYIPSEDDIWALASPRRDHNFTHGDKVGTNVGIYVNNDKFMRNLVEIVSDGGEVRDLDAVLSMVKVRAASTTVDTSRHLVVVNNGIFNIETKQLEEFSPHRVFTKKSSTDYIKNPQNPVLKNPDGTTWDVDTWLADLASSPDVNTLFWQIISASLQGNRNMKKSPWFYSKEGNNGKGTLGLLIRNLVGNGNHSSLSVEDFNHEFMKEKLLRAVVNIADENNVNAYIDAVKDYKASVTGDPIPINRKHKAILQAVFRGLNIQMMNGLPKTKDKTDSFYRRIILIPFTKSFTNHGEREYIKEDYIHRTNVLEYVLQKALHLNFDEFIMPAESLAIMNEYKLENDPVRDFWADLRDRFKWDLLPKTFLWDLYKKWEVGTNPGIAGKKGKTAFYREVDAIIAHDPDWSNNDGKSIFTKGLMDADEPLISEYGLDVPPPPYKGTAASQWFNHSYTGENMEKKRDFVRQPNYRGYVRL